MNYINELELLFESRKNELFFYSSYSFLREINENSLFQNTVRDPLLKKIKNNTVEIINIKEGGQSFLFLVEYLKWDSDYFNFPTYRLHTVLFDNTNSININKALNKFKRVLFNNGENYCFTIIPSEDIILLQALTGSGFNLIETRLTYWLSLCNYNYERFSVREATIEDIPNLRRVASEMRNPFDRFHADPIFESDKADEFLASFVEESIKGLADYTIVPNEPGLPPDAFLTAKFLKSEWPIIGTKVSKLVLAAVSSKTCKGWYKKMISEMAHYLKLQGAEYVFMHPGSTNKAGLYTYESLGARIGQVNHVLSFHL